MNFENITIQIEQEKLLKEIIPKIESDRSPHRIYILLIFIINLYAVTIQFFLPELSNLLRWRINSFGAIFGGMMDEKFMNICGVPTRVRTFGKSLDEPFKKKEIVLCITGNPGITGFYTIFITSLFKYLANDTPVWVIGEWKIWNWMNLSSNGVKRCWTSWFSDGNMRRIENCEDNWMEQKKTLNNIPLTLPMKWKFRCEKNGNWARNYWFSIENVMFLKIQSKITITILQSQCARISSS